MLINTNKSITVPENHAVKSKTESLSTDLEKRIFQT